MKEMTLNSLVESLRENVMPFSGAPSDFDPLMELIGDSRFVLIGEASHGTHEFYETRAMLTKRLIEGKGFTAIAVEADWPDAYRVNSYVRGVSDDKTAEEALRDFQRFPTWMWRNTVVLDFVNWLKSHNAGVSHNTPKVGFYGLDLYSLHASMEAVIKYLDTVDPEAAKRARYRYGCFEDFDQDPQGYGYAVSLGLDESCEKQTLDQLFEIQRRAADYMRLDGRIAEDAYFYAEQNARLARNAEVYYRSMFKGRVSTWNLRDRHMVETLTALHEHLSNQQGDAKIVIWAHNSHLGDARATDMGDIGEVNIGHLVREQYGSDTTLIGFSTYMGTVTAASDWGGTAERKRVRPGLPESYEALFHQVDIPNFYLPLRASGQLINDLAQSRIQRAIGVIYRPDTERQSHYFHVRLPYQFDAMLHFDETRALEPLERESIWERGELPETYPTGV